MRTELVDNVTVAHSVTQACVTSIQALTTAINSIQAGEHDTMIVGGADSMDDLPLGVGRKLTKALMGLQKAKTAMDRVRLLSLTISPKDLVPPMPGYSVEPSTGMSMGQHCETMVKDWGISREWQDKIAHESHTRAGQGLGGWVLRRPGDAGGGSALQGRRSARTTSCAMTPSWRTTRSFVRCMTRSTGRSPRRTPRP